MAILLNLVKVKCLAHAAEVPFLRLVPMSPVCSSGGNFFYVRTSPISIRICVPNLVAVRRSCRKKGGIDTHARTHARTHAHTDRQTDTAAL